MLANLTDSEKEIMHFLVQGYNFIGISDFIGIKYSTFVNSKKSIFKKLHIKRTTEILSVLLNQGINPDEI